MNRTRHVGSQEHHMSWCLVAWLCVCGIGFEVPLLAFPPPKPKAKTGSKFGAEPKTLMPVWQDAKQKKRWKPAKTEEYVPDVDPAGDPAEKLGSIKLPTPDPKEFSTSLIISKKSQRALISYLKPGKPGGGQTRLVMCDLKAGTVLGSISVPIAAVPLALSDSGELMAIRFLPEAGLGEENHVEVWGWSDKSISREVRFLLHEDSPQINERITFAAFLDDARLVTVSTMKQLMIWDWRTAKLLFVYDEFQPMTQMKVSANAKYLFAASLVDDFAVLNTSNYELAGWLDSQGMRREFRVSSSGKQLLSSCDEIRVGGGSVRTIPNGRSATYFDPAELGLGRLLAFPDDDWALFESVEKPKAPVAPEKPSKVVKKVAPKPAPAAPQSPGTIAIRSQAPGLPGELDFYVHRIDPSVVSTGKVTLVDLRFNVRAWEFAGVERLAEAGATCWCLTQPERGQSPQLVPLKMPGQDLKEQVAKAVAEPDYFVLRGGGVVKLNLSGLPMEDREPGVAVLAKRLKLTNITIGDESDIELVARVGPYVTRKVTTVAGFFQGNPTFEFPTHRQLTVPVSLLLKGQPVHSVVLTNEPSPLNKKQGETTQQFYDRNPGTPLEILERLYIPKVLFGPNGNRILGSTNVVELASPE